MKNLSDTGIAERYQADVGGYWFYRKLWQIFETVNLLID
jgi:hypothetical protein